MRFNKAMKKTLICIALALVMTLPVMVGLAHLPGVFEWIDSGMGHDLFEYLFIALDAQGCEETADVIAVTMLIVSFFLSLALVVATWAIVGRWRRMHRR
ncbi:hypothetical protein G3N58_20750 [Paraburkholderia sp. Ac-20342]|uniref:hypothetical protein n=1 Tax=Paraburkholderia sp. Ac-20342 TaxID=2703889 RepID=UPI00197CD5C6|nr:hypothetical protein [Paraburkholderia sp. Ac-20342]MBN3849234.1 hypothetical protein [Paraburkholderia sp. Ac-20342]